MQTPRDQGHGAKAIISSYPDKGWKSSSIKKVCSRVDCTGSAVLRKPDSERPATASACAVCRSGQVGRPYQALKQCYCHCNVATEIHA